MSPARTAVTTCSTAAMCARASGTAVRATSPRARGGRARRRRPPPPRPAPGRARGRCRRRGRGPRPTSASRRSAGGGRAGRRRRRAAAGRGPRGGAVRTRPVARPTAWPSSDPSRRRPRPPGPVRSAQQGAGAVSRGPSPRRRTTSTGPRSTTSTGSAARTVAPRPPTGRAGPRGVGHPRAVRARGRRRGRRRGRASTGSATRAALRGHARRLCPATRPAARRGRRPGSRSVVPGCPGAPGRRGPDPGRGRRRWGAGHGGAVRGRRGAGGGGLDGGDDGAGRRPALDGCPRAWWPSPAARVTTPPGGCTGRARPGDARRLGGPGLLRPRRRPRAARAAPADPAVGPRSPPGPEDQAAYVRRSVDLAMRGGATSGVVYPLAVCEIARDMRVRNVGGASAGAIAAACTAAAELGRSSGREGS